MSMMKRKSEAYLQEALQRGEKVLQTSSGADGRHEIFVALTDRRIFIYRMGMTIMSEPTLNEVRLDHVIEVNCLRGSLGLGPTLVIRARSGVFQFTLSGTGRKVAGQWPNWILGAQQAFQKKATPSAPTDITSRLSQLSELHRAGALTAEEFAAAKARLLG